MQKVFIILISLQVSVPSVFCQENNPGKIKKGEFCGYTFTDTLLLRKNYQAQLDFLDLKDGDTVIDVGTGSGSYIGALNVITVVKKAHFILVDIDSNCLNPLKVNNMINYYETLHGAKFNNTFSMLLNTPDSLYLPANRYKKLLILNTLHEVRDREEMARQLAAVLKPGGELIVGEMPPMGRKKIHQGCNKPLMRTDEIVNLFARFGLTPTGQENVQPVLKARIKHPYYFLRLTKM